VAGHVFLVTIISFFSDGDYHTCWYRWNKIHNTLDYIQQTNAGMLRYVGFGKRFIALCDSILIGIAVNIARALELDTGLCTGSHGCSVDLLCRFGIVGRQATLGEKPG
jgi:hypothetical protein